MPEERKKKKGKNKGLSRKEERGRFQSVSLISDVVFCTYTPFSSLSLTSPYPATTVGGQQQEDNNRRGHRERPQENNKRRATRAWYQEKSRRSNGGPTGEPQTSNRSIGATLHTPTHMISVYFFCSRVPCPVPNKVLGLILMTSLDRAGTKKVGIPNEVLHGLKEWVPNDVPEW
jgi:hypothetical protein